jgi:hypothetical protein
MKAMAAPEGRHGCGRSRAGTTRIARRRKDTRRRARPP